LVGKRLKASGLRLQMLGMEHAKVRVESKGKGERESLVSGSYTARFG
jgi:hypothetical protein